MKSATLVDFAIAAFAGVGCGLIGGLAIAVVALVLMGTP